MFGAILLLVVASSGCENDNDCKGDRICENHLCVSPPAVSVPAPASADGVPPIPPPEPTAPPALLVPAPQPRMSPAKRELPQANPPPEIGIMVTQSLVGALTAGAVTLLPYFLMFSNGGFSDPTLQSALFILNFAVSPVAVAGAETLIGRGSRIYAPELWIPALVGLGAQAAVLSLYYATGWLPTTERVYGSVPRGGSAALLMIGSIAVVPLLEMVVLNLFKERRPSALVALDDTARRAGVVLSPPALVPVIAASPSGMVWGLQLSPLRGRF